MTAYAKGTSVAVEKTRSEIDRLLRGVGATSIVSGWSAERADVGFEARGRRLRFRIAMPDPKKVGRGRGGFALSAARAKVAVEAEERRLWRALLFVIKAKLESVESGIETFDEAFLAAIVVPSEEGVTTVGDYIAPALAAAYARGAAMPPLLGAAGDSGR